MVLTKKVNIEKKGEKLEWLNRISNPALPNSERDKRRKATLKLFEIFQRLLPKWQKTENCDKTLLGPSTSSRLAIITIVVVDHQHHSRT